MLFPDTIWYVKQSMVKCKRNKIDIYYNRGVSRFNISRDFRPPEFKSNLINQNRKGCGAKRVRVDSKRKLRIINRVRSDENTAK